MSPPRDPTSQLWIAKIKDEAKLDSLISRANALIKQGVPKDQLLWQLNKDDAGLGLSLTPGQLDHFYAELSSTKIANR